MKAFLARACKGIQWAWERLLAAVNFLIDFVRWCRERGKTE